MKPKKLTILHAALLTAIMLGAIYTLARAPAVVGANVTWDPKTFTWVDGSFPPQWNAEVGLKGGHKAQTEINVTTTRLEGIYAPNNGYPALHGPRLILNFTGADVGAAIFNKLPLDHMFNLIPGTYRVNLVINGTLYTGETFQGDGVIAVTVPPP